MAERNKNGRCGTRTHGLHDVNVAVTSADELTAEQIDYVLSEFDRTEPGLQRRIIAGLAIKAMELDAMKAQAENPPAANLSEADRPRRRCDWTEEEGPALWWRFPVVEPPYAGSPLDFDFPGNATHWTPILVPREPE